ncbi:hypothetical protein COS80_01750 [Candidatus Woesebacteria bacterium CG06_land_8_20_14_3_00_39_27]|uniref:Peptidase M1 membrane alanine aminopeptidase domain-containing protein n=1 Tax=Candidatus Woesebacteria bacterium CG06_land_8_20_14_3_00_39_27 TaxID=1975057 RepID=A0A2M7APY8_9BACT|nr:MAG: hypothetical protein COS80_01750 [Candidatus Woesebacteria bacterium CG06_land_8_20_14_3_00_39_27]
MFENYLASSEDLNTIVEVLSYVRNPKLNFVFSNKSKISETAIVSYDSKFIYIWRLSSEKLEYKIPHKIKIKDEWQFSWRVNIWIGQIINVLPSRIKNKSRFEIPVISGGLLMPFISLQKAGNVFKNPYVTRESYLATIIHEFGHIYWNSFKMWWPSDKEKNLRYLKIAKDLYEGKSKKINESLHFPGLEETGEIFAFCTEYYASELFWKKHKRNLDSFIENRLNTLTILEKKKNLEKEDSVIEPRKYPHDFAFVFGKIILEKYPTSWPKILTDQKNISPQF